MQTVFISSTFKDMQAERDMLMLDVLPEINARVRKYGESIGFVDLRWGIDTSDLETDESYKKILSVCFDEIDHARPYMIVLIGERYGYIPNNQSLISNTAIQKTNLSISEIYEKSITELEILYGALSGNMQLDHCLFYFREHVNDAPQYFYEVDPEQIKRLDILKSKIKEKIAKTNNCSIKTYKAVWSKEKNVLTDLDALSEMIIDDLSQLLDVQWKKNEREMFSWQEREILSAWNNYQGINEFFNAREDYCNSLINNILLDDIALFIVRGETGSGKSSILAHTAMCFKSRGHSVLPFIGGQTSNSSSVIDIIKQDVYLLEKLLGKEKHFGTESPFELSEWRQYWATLLEEYEDNVGSIKHVLIIDSFDLLAKDEISSNFLWMPNSIPDCLKVIVSCSNKFEISPNASLQIKLRFLNLDGLNDHEKYEVIKSNTSFAHKELGSDIIKGIIALPESSNPLYLSVIIQRLLILNNDDFNIIDYLGGDIKAINEYMLQVIEASPKGETALSLLCATVIGEAAKRINYDQNIHILNLFAVSRHGLRENDIKEIFKQCDYNYMPLDFYRLMKYMHLYFYEDKNGRWNYTHEVFREGLLSNLSRSSLGHYLSKIFNYVIELPLDDCVRLDEFILLAYMLNNKVEFVNSLSQYENKANKEELEILSSGLLDIINFDKGKWLLEILNDYSINTTHEFLHYISALHVYTSKKSTENIDYDILCRILECNYRRAKKTIKKTRENYVNTFLFMQLQMFNVYTKNSDLQKIDQLLESFNEDVSCFSNIIKKTDMQMIGIAYWGMCTLYDQQGKIEIALSCANKALDFYEKGQDVNTRKAEYNHNLASIMNSIGVISIKLGMHEEAEKMWLRSLDISNTILDEKWNEILAYSITLCNLGNLYSNKNVLKAEEYYIKAVHSCEQLAKRHPETLLFRYGKFMNPLCKMQMNLGSFYNDIGKHKKAEYYLLQAKDTAELCFHESCGGNVMDFLESHLLLAKHYIETDSSKALENYIQVFNVSSVIATTNENLELIMLAIDAAFDISKIFLKLSDLDSALKYMGYAYNIALEGSNNHAKFTVFDLKVKYIWLYYEGLCEYLHNELNIKVKDFEIIKE